jgi:hypothetical protein
MACYRLDGGGLNWDEYADEIDWDNNTLLVLIGPLDAQAGDLSGLDFDPGKVDLADSFG